MPSSTARGASPAIRCGAAMATQADLADAVKQAVDEAHQPLGDEPADLTFIFATGSYGNALRPAFEMLGDLTPSRCLIGTTAEGVLAGDREREREPAVAVWTARLPGTTVTPFAIDYTQTPDGGSFQGWPADLHWPEHGALLLVADPFSFPVDRLIQRLDEDHPGFPVIGGMASGGGRPGANTLLLNRQTFTAGAVGVLISGATRVRPLVSQGCRPIGQPLVVTKATDNMLVELGGRPAFTQLQDLYGVLDDRDRRLMRTSLHLGRVASEYQDRFGRGDFLVRNVLGADPETGVVAIGDQIRVGQTVQFHVRDADTAHEDLSELLRHEVERPPAGCLVFTCNGRGTRLFPAPSHDALCLQEALGPVPSAGFFAQGELGPIGRKNCVHGFTASIALFTAAD